MGIIECLCCVPQKQTKLNKKSVPTKPKRTLRKMSDEDGWPVSCLSWDITVGLAGTAFGHFILNATSASEDQCPDSIDHTGITIYGNLYEYGDLGILKTEIPTDPPEGYEIKSKYPAFSLRSTEPMGYTQTTQAEFEAWVEEQNNGDFQGSNYNVIDRSCVVFARKACEYLKVPYPENWDHIINWAIRNKKFTSIVGAAGFNSRKAQHKTTEYVTDPSKIKDKVKRLYRKIKPKKKKNREKRGLAATAEVQEGDENKEKIAEVGEEEEEHSDEEDEGSSDSSSSSSSSSSSREDEKPENNSENNEENAQTTEDSKSNTVPEN